jgi:uncharacterized membrane protein YccC
MQLSKNIILGSLVAGSLLISGTSSVAWGHGWHSRVPGEIRRDLAEIERDRRELNRSERELRRDLHRGANPAEIARDRREVRRDRRELRESYAELHQDRHKYPWWRPYGWRNWYHHWHWW